MITASPSSVYWIHVMVTYKLCYHQNERSTSFVGQNQLLTNDLHLIFVVLFNERHTYHLTHLYSCTHEPYPSNQCMRCYNSFDVMIAKVTCSKFVWCFMWRTSSKMCTYYSPIKECENNVQTCLVNAWLAHGFAILYLFSCI